VVIISSGPLEIWTTIWENYVAKGEPGFPPGLYRVEDAWERRIHDLLGVPWPCSATAKSSKMAAMRAVNEPQTAGRIGALNMANWRMMSFRQARSGWQLGNLLQAITRSEMACQGRRWDKLSFSD
jgi:hypothetical protein